MNVKMVIADATKWVAWGQCKVTQIFGYNNNASDDRYIQLHATPTVANGDVPAVAALFAPAAAPFGWIFEEPIQLSELLIAISSTQVNYTAVTNTGLDLTAVVETDFAVNSATTVAGDLTTGVARLVVWADVNGPKKLFRVDVKNNSGSTSYAFVSGDVGNDEIKQPYSGPYRVADGETKSFWFGRAGHSPKFVKASTGVVTEGCEIINSDVATMGAGNSAAAATSWNIRAIYE